MSFGPRCRQQYRPVHCNAIESHVSTYRVRMGEPSFALRESPNVFGTRWTEEQLVLVIEDMDLSSASSLHIDLSACPARNHVGAHHVPGFLKLYKACPYLGTAETALEAEQTEGEEWACPHFQTVIRTPGTYWIELTTFDDVNPLVLTVKCSKLTSTPPLHADWKVNAAFGLAVVVLAAWVRRLCTHRRTQRVRRAEVNPQPQTMWAELYPPDDPPLAQMAQRMEKPSLSGSEPGNLDDQSSLASASTLSGDAGSFESFEVPPPAAIPQQNW